MPSYGQEQLNYQAQNGNSVTVLLGELAVAFAQTAGPSIGFGSEALYGIGTSKPQEIQQLRISPSFSLTAFALTAAGQTLLGNGQNIAYILANNSFDIHVADALGNVIFTYVGCVAGSVDSSIPANGIITQSIPFLAMDVLDNNGDSILNGNNAISVSNAAAIAGAAAGGLGLNS